MTTQTVRTLAPYLNRAPAPTFLSGMFAVTADSYKNSEQVRWDVDRDDEDIAFPLPAIDTGAYNNYDDKYNEKLVVPPAYGEKFSVSASSLGMNRQLGKTEYDDPGFVREASERIAIMTRKVLNKIRRGVELQASQILTLVDGLNLTNDAGVQMFALDYHAKATHFPNAGTAWSSATDVQMRSDLSSLGSVIRADGKYNPRRVIMGAASYELFVNAHASTKFYDNERSDRGQIYRLTTPGADSAAYRGSLDIETQRYDIWTYDGQYKHPQTGTMTNYVPDDKVIMLSENMGLETVFGRVFKFNNGQAPLPGMRGRGKMREKGLDIFYNNWTELNGSGITVEMTARPLLIPKGIDTFGCLDTGI